MVESEPLTATDAQGTAETQDSNQPNRRVYKKVVRPKTNAEQEAAGRDE